MILSPYRNPPYRTPTPGGSLSPPPGPSPKRKRGASSPVNLTNRPSTPALEVNTTLQNHDAASPETGADSPRTKVAKKFQNLDIRSVAQTNGTHRKRLKRNPHLRSDSDVELDDDEFSAPEPSSSSSPTTSFDQQHNDSPFVEIRETPDCRSRIMHSSPPSQAVSPPERSERQQRWNGFQATHAATSPPPSVPASPQPARKDSANVVADPALSPRGSRDFTSTLGRQAQLTWQEDEITGHDIDQTSPDDDGEGINGIGFKPTPALAYARSQRRKQQVSEWRAREAREARQRRMDRRRRSGGSFSRITGVGSSTSKRTVRFAVEG